MVRRVFLGGGVPLVGLQEELRYPSGYTPKVSKVYFHPRAWAGGDQGPGGRWSTNFGVQYRDTNKQTYPRGGSYIEGLKEEFDLMIFGKNPFWGTVLKFSQRHWRLLVEVRRGDVGVAPERVMYIRLPLYSTFTLNHIKALSKTLPNIHASSRFPSSLLTSTKNSESRRCWLNFSTVPQGRFFLKIM